MLVNEGKINEGEGVLFSHPTLGLGYQSAGAFQRLGRRMMGILRHDKEKLSLRHVPMESLYIDPLTANIKDHSEKMIAAAVFTPEPYLSRNEALPLIELEALKKQALELQSAHSDLRLLIALPSAQNDAAIKDFLGGLKNFTLFLCPALFGFRDNNLLDTAIRFLKECPDLLTAPNSNESTTELCFTGDVAAYFVSAVDKIESHEKIFLVPSTTQSLSEWQKQFCETFSPQSHWLERLAGRLSGKSLASEVNLGKSLHHSLEFESLEKIFPVNPTSLKRALSLCAMHFHKQPSVQLLFPPGRNP